MAKNINKPVKKTSPQAAKQPVQQKQVQAVKEKITTPPAEKNFFKRYFNVIVPVAIAVLTWLFYRVCLGNQLTNWDDPGYIKDNALIKDVSAEGIKNIFSIDNPVMGNYHPLTILSYAIEYSYVRLNPWLYHLDSVLFHIVVTLLVYWFVQVLTRRPIAAAVAAMLFGLHPMHVESVAWLAGRKDVVYGMFYMAACVAYVYYVRAQTDRSRVQTYALVLLLFICSLLGKPVAVVLPLTLLLIDYFEKRKPGAKLFIEKIPLFLISIIFGLKSLRDQKAFLSLDTHEVTYNFFERIALGGYAFVTYLWKALVPVGLSNFYPYPEKADGILPFVYYLYPLGAAVLVGIIVMFARRNRMIVFGSLFFLVNIVLLLQFIPVGGAIVADRYSYISYLGLFVMAGWFVAQCFEPGANKQLGQILLIVTVGYSFVLGYMTSERCKAWYDTTSLWRDEIEKEPRRAPNAWNNLGFNYFNKFNDAVNPQEKKIYYDSAFYLLSKAIELQPNFVNPYISIGELERSVGKFAEAKVNYYHAIKIKTADDELANAYLGLAIIYAISRNFDSSAFCFRSALAAKQYFPEAHSNFGNFYDMTDRPDSALKEYGLAIVQNPDMFAPHLNRGRLLQKLHRCDEAMKDFDIALQLNPDDGEIFYAKAFCDAQKGDKRRAVQDIETAMKLGFTGVNKAFYDEMRR